MTAYGVKKGTFANYLANQIRISEVPQKEIAEAYIKQLTDAKVFPAPIVTQVTELKGFYPAEDYHQDFVKHHPTHPYVVQNSLPKLEKLKKQFPELVKKQS